ncbi:DUF1707 domain-containing protein [Geodermatophilus sp. SYSU D00758]
MSEPVRPEDLRVSDPERAVVQERLRRAVAAGQLDLHEFDTRVQSVWAARTRGELARVTRDLPEPPPPPPAPKPPPPLGRAFSHDAAGTAMRVLTIVFASIAAVNLVVWGLVAGTTDASVHAWWVWTAGPPAAALAVLYLVGIGRPRR